MSFLKNVMSDANAIFAVSCAALKPTIEDLYFKSDCNKV